MSKLTAEEACAWLESLAPYSTAERDQRHMEIAALIRALEAVRVAAEKRCDCGAGCSTSCASWDANDDCDCGFMGTVEALAACDRIMQREKE